MPDTDAIIRAIRAALAESEAIVQRARTERRPRPQPVLPLPPLPVERALSIGQRIAVIVECVRLDRRVSAGIALVQLRQWYEASDAMVFEEGERTWSDFLAKRVPLDPALVETLLGGVLRRGGVLQCSICRTVSACQCACGAPYVPEHPFAAAAAQPHPQAQPQGSALDRAIAAVKASPEKSDRAIAAEIGVGKDTVRRARAILKASPTDAPVDAPVGNRVGRDGRRRRLPRGVKLRFAIARMGGVPA